MDVGHTNGWRLDDVVPAAEIVRTIDEVYPLEPVDPNYRGEVARRWRYRDGSGEIGVIASVTQPFCGDCTRARITADGRFFTCLFGIRGHDLRALVRGGASDGDLAEAIGGVWTIRTDRYSEIRSERTVDLEKVEMSCDRRLRPAAARGRIVGSMSTYSEASTRRLPRGWAHLVLQFAIWIGFYVVYQVARGAADQSVTRAFENGQWVIDFQRSLHSMIELPLQHARRELLAS